jgi:hypothetical protein
MTLLQCNYYYAFTICLYHARLLFTIHPAMRDFRSSASNFSTAYERLVWRSWIEPPFRVIGRRT